MMSKDIFTYPIPQYLKEKLHRSKFVLVKDFNGLTADTLSSETELTKSEAEDVLSILNASSCNVISAAEHYAQYETNNITTSSTALDSLLDGGIRLSKVTEICGLPGTGKTQLCLQLAINVQIPKSKNGVGGEAFYVDTEGSFSVERLTEMARGLWKSTTEPAKLSHVEREHSRSMESDSSRYLTSYTKEAQVLQLENDRQMTIDSIFQSIHYYRCLNLMELLAIINILEEFIMNHRKVKLVVIDNLTYHFRSDLGQDISTRSSILHNLSQTFIRLAQKNNLAIILTNQMTTRISADGQSSIVPGLGDSWNHACCTRILLLQDNKKRLATVLKSSYLPENKVSFRIESIGIRNEDNVPSDTNIYKNITADEASVSVTMVLDNQSLNDGCGTSSAAQKRRRLDDDVS